MAFKNTLILRILLIMFFASFSESYKVLVAILSPSTSHYNQGKAISDILHEKGHEITFMTGYPSKKLPYREIQIPEVADNSFEVDFEEVSQEQSYFKKFMFVFDIDIFIPMMLNNAFRSERFQQFLSDKNEEFDLIILDYLLTEAFFGIAVKFNCPLILINPGPMYSSLAIHTGNPTSPATIPDTFLGLPYKMNFVERVMNTLMGVLLEAHEFFYNEKSNKDMYEKYFPEEAKRFPYSQLYSKVAMIFSNTHPALGTSRPFLPNVVEISGFHINEAQPLPKEYKDILDNAKNGVIFFSLGSYVKTHKMPKHMRDVVLKSLSKLKETVLWKFETELEGLPKNVIIKKWMPQTSILEHPNVKLFISHGGVLSVTEAINAGKPALMIPVFADQLQNARIIEHAQTGEILPLSALSEATLDKALNQMLTNQTYTDNAKKLQKLFKDRPMPPKSLISFYAEHVIRTEGAKHLSAPHLNRFSSMLLDVIAVLVIPPVLLFVAMICLCKKLCSSKKQVVHSKKKTN